MICPYHFVKGHIMQSLLRDFLDPTLLSWQRKEISKKIDQFETDASVVDGVVRWNSNNRVPPLEFLELWNHLGKDFDFEKSKKVSDVETDAFLAEYRRNYRGPSAEEMVEMRANFEPGTTMINAITGTTFKI